MAGLVLGWAAEDKVRRAQPPAIREFMRQKLNHSQAVLEGITLEDYDLILVNARKLGAMSQEGVWQAVEGTEYAEHSANFRRNAAALVKAANLASLDGATLAYVRMTMSCVECHKYVRGRKSASLNPPLPSQAVSVAPLVAATAEVAFLPP